MTGTLAIVFAAVAVLVLVLGVAAMVRSRREAGEGGGDRERGGDGDGERAGPESDGLDFPDGFESFDSAEARLERHEAERKRR